MVALEKHVAYQNQVHAGPGGTARGRLAALHTHAQNPQSTDAGFAIPGLPGGLLDQNFRSRCGTLQRPGHSTSGGVVTV